MRTRELTFEKVLVTPCRIVCRRTFSSFTTSKYLLVSRLLGSHDCLKAKILKNRGFTSPQLSVPCKMTRALTFENYILSEQSRTEDDIDRLFPPDTAGMSQKKPKESYQQTKLIIEKSAEKDLGPPASHTRAALQACQKLIKSPIKQT